MGDNCDGKSLLDSYAMLLQTGQAEAANSQKSAGIRAKFSPALPAATLYAVCTSALLIASWFYCDRHFIYAMDDTYITMAMARNLALHGVWGVTPYAFSSSNSSPIFPLLVAAAYRIFGVNRFAPLVLSWIFGLLSIFVAERLLVSFLSRKQRTFALILLVLFAPLFVVGIIGMEHSLHLLLTLLFLGYFLEDATAKISSKQLVLFGIITALMVSARYEGLFLVFPAGCLLLARRRWKPLLAMSIGAAVPVLSYAAFSLAHGGYWLPNSVALKGAQGDHPSLAHMAANIGARIASNYHDGAQLFWVLGIIAVVTAALGLRHIRSAIPLLLVLVAGCFQIALAQVGMYYRYDSYLFAAAIVALGSALPQLPRLIPKQVFLGIYFATLAAGGLFVLLSLAQMHMLPRIARNIYLRQWQMARFVQRYYPNGVVAANDIGAINYLSNIHCYDFVGLANPEIFEARRSGRYTTDFLRRDTSRQQVQIAIAYDRWFGDPMPIEIGGPPLPSNWVRVARWYIPDPTIVGDVYVSFYAVNPAQAGTLRSDVLQFASQLPTAVHTLPE